MNYATTELTIEPSNQHSRRSVVAPWCAVFLAAFALYGATANRGIQWQDAGLHLVRILAQTPENPLGLALSHPLHHLLGRLFVSLFGGIVEPCFAITLVSALAAAVTIANVFGCSLQLTGSKSAAFFAAASLAVAHTFWQFATLAETYTITTALLSAEAWCVVDYSRTHRARALSSAFFINGLSVANHMLGALTTPVLIALSLQSLWSRKSKARQLILQAGLWMLGASPYLWLIAAHWARAHALGETIHSALFGNAFADRVLNMRFNAPALGRVAAFVILNFPSLFLPIAILGLFASKRVGVPTLTRRLLLAGLCIHFLFAIRYNVIDEYTFMLPTYVMLCLFAAVGFTGLASSEPGRSRMRRTLAGALLVLTPVSYFFAPALARSMQVLGADARHKPYRDDYVYLFTPWSFVEQSADQLGRHAVELAGDRGYIVIEDAMAEPAVRYYRIRTGRENISIVSNPSADYLIEAAKRGVSIVLVPARVDAPRTPPPPEGTWRRNGDLYVFERNGNSHD